MALVNELKRTTLERCSVHGSVECTYTTFVKNGVKYLQIDTYGSKGREYPNKKSQSLQFDETSLSLIDITPASLPVVLTASEDVITTFAATSSP